MAFSGIIILIWNIKFKKCCCKLLGQEANVKGLQIHFAIYYCSEITPVPITAIGRVPESSWIIENSIQGRQIIGKKQDNFKQENLLHQGLDIDI